MTDFKVAFLGYRAEWELERLRQHSPAAVQVSGVPEGASDTEVAEVCADADVIIPWRIRISTDIARSSSRLKLVQALSAGTDYMPVAELAEMGIKVANNGGGNASAVAEYTVALMVGACRRMPLQMRQLRQGTYHQGFFERWEGFPELTGKRVGIVGLGRIGTGVARRLVGWECEVVYHDIAPVSPEHEQRAGASRVTFDELIDTADIITLHVPLNRVTRRMIGAAELKRMKSSAILINTSRGPVVDETALAKALEDGQIAAAALDVTEIEPIEPNNPLLSLDNVMLTPHLAGMTLEARHKSLDFAIYNAARLAAGDQPEAVILPV